MELHGCHEYLLCQFFNRKVNRRQDRYGQKPWLLAEEILRGIREVTPESFIIGLRLGGFEPTLADAVENSGDPERQADLARSKLDLVEPGEYIFRFTD